MHPFALVLIISCMLLQNSAHAGTGRTHETPFGETIVPALLIGGSLGLMVYFLYKPVSYMIAHDDELSKSRLEKLVLLEAGRANEYGSSYTAGVLANQNQLVLGRLSQHLSPDGNMRFKSYELGYRHYARIWFGELGLFRALHQESRIFHELNRRSSEYRFDAYETKGVFISLGTAVSIWQASLGFRATVHRGISTQTLQSYENNFTPSQSAKEESRDRYRLRGTGYIELGLVL